VYCKWCGGSYVLSSSTGTVEGVGWGIPEDASPVMFTPADYDGDGRSDVAYYDRSTRTFSIIRSASGTTQVISVAAQSSPGDVPVLRRPQ
jgi:hypothetical protein